LVNEFFAAISTTSAYNDVTVWSLHADLEQYDSQTYINGYESYEGLRILHDRNGSFELADVVADILTVLFVLAWSRCLG